MLSLLSNRTWLLETINLNINRIMDISNSLNKDQPLVKEIMLQITNKFTLNGVLIAQHDLLLQPQALQWTRVTNFMRSIRHDSVLQALLATKTPIYNQFWRKSKKLKQCRDYKYYKYWNIVWIILKNKFIKIKMIKFNYAQICI